MVTTRIRPKTMVSNPSKRASTSGSSDSSAAPNTEPQIEAMPPTTTMVTSSTDFGNPAMSGVMKAT